MPKPNSLFSLLMLAMACFLISTPFGFSQILIDDPAMKTKAPQQGSGFINPSQNDVPTITVPRPARKFLQGGVTQKAPADDFIQKLKKQPAPNQAQKKLNKSPEQTLVIESVDFYYKADEELYFVDLKTKHQNQHHGLVSAEVQEDLAWQAFDKATLEKSFTKWVFHDHPKPNVLMAKAHLYNNTGKAHLNVAVKLYVDAYVGDLRVNPDTLLVNFDHLETTAQWERIMEETLIIPALEPGEELRLTLMRLNLKKYLRLHTNQWPTKVQVSVELHNFNQTNGETLELVPDHFLIPTLY